MHQYPIASPVNNSIDNNCNSVPGDGDRKKEIEELMKIIQILIVQVTLSVPTCLHLQKGRKQKTAEGALIESEAVLVSVSILFVTATGKPLTGNLFVDKPVRAHTVQDNFILSSRASSRLETFGESF